MDGRECGPLHRVLLNRIRFYVVVVSLPVRTWRPWLVPVRYRSCSQEAKPNAVRLVDVRKHTSSSNPVRRLDSLEYSVNNRRGPLFTKSCDVLAYLRSHLSRLDRWCAWCGRV